MIKRPRVSLLSTYRQSWKARNHHFIRYSDVKLKDERRPTISDLANQKHVMEQVDGWKIFHLSAQVDEMVRFFGINVFLTKSYISFIFRHTANRKCMTA